MEPPPEAPEPPAPDAQDAVADEAADEEDDAPQDPPAHDIADRARYAGSFYSPELNATYRILDDGGGGLVLHAGRLDPATLRAESAGVLADSRGMTFRFSALEDGRYQAMTVDAGRVRNLRFERVEG